jgi:hypothetical protein
VATQLEKLLISSSPGSTTTPPIALKKLARTELSMMILAISMMIPALLLAMIQFITSLPLLVATASSSPLLLVDTSSHSYMPQSLSQQSATLGTSCQMQINKLLLVLFSKSKL